MQSKSDKSSAFQMFSEKSSEWVGSAWGFYLSLITTLAWVTWGSFTHYSDTWQLVMNTLTSVATFLIVFIIQNSQNRDFRMIKIKLDELLRSHAPAKNSIIDIQKLSDAQLKALEEKYCELCPADSSSDTEKTQNADNPD